MNYLIWKGKDSRNIKGLVISELPPISKPNMRVAETAIDGVDGSIIEELGYESYDKQLIIGITQNADINAIIEYFTGEGEVVFSNESDKYYKAKIFSRIDFARLGRFKTATVTFRVQPFKYEYLEEATILEDGMTEIIINNIGNYQSRPIIEIKGTGEVTFTVNGNTLFRYTFPEGEDTVIIDSQKQDAYMGTNLKNRNMVGEFPIFGIGENIITWDGAVTGITISAKSRWL